MEEQHVIYCDPTSLQPHSGYYAIYESDENIDPVFEESIQNTGLLEPLIITPQKLIISGVLRWRVALKLNLPEVPVLISSEEPDITSIIIHNQGRTKTKRQILNELKHLKKIRCGQGTRTDIIGKTGKSSEDISDMLGLSITQLNRLENIEKLLEDKYKGHSQKDELLKAEWQKLETGAYSISGLYEKLKQEAGNKQNIKNCISPIFKSNAITLLNKTCEDLSDLEDNSVNCIISSPPYYAARVYQNGSAELGQEKSVEEYINNLVSILNITKNKLAPDGSLIINIADSTNVSQHCVPHRLVVEMLKNQWKLNSEVIWLKCNPPFSDPNLRPNPSHEYIFQFYHGDKRPFYDSSWVSKSTELEKPLIYGEKNLKSAWNFNGVFLETSVANTNALKKQLDANRVIMTHPAVMNEVVAEVLIKTFSPVGGLVADVFCGINTTGIKCAQLGREFVGYEINKSFFQQGVERTKLLYCDNKNETLRSII